MKYRDTASFGKRQEYRAIADLLSRGYDVYQTMVDDQQIDCIIRLNGPQGPKYIDIQIKARSQFAQKKSWGDWPSVKMIDPRPNLIFIFYSEPLNARWIVPSLIIETEGYQAPSSKHKSEYRFTFAKLRKMKCETSFEYVESLDQYRVAYSIIDNFYSNQVSKGHPTRNLPRPPH